MSIVTGCGLNLTSIATGDLEGADRLMACWAELGCSHVEISARRLDIIVGGQLSMPAVRRVANMIDRHGMAPVLHAPHGINLMDRPRRDMHVAAAEASIEFCRITGCSSMVLHSGHVPAQEWVVHRDALLSEESDQMRRLGDLAEQAGKPDRQPVKRRAYHLWCRSTRIGHAACCRRSPACGGLS